MWLDTAHGRMNFSFDVGRRVHRAGLLPHCISTDLTVPGRIHTVHSMTEIMTRFLGLGFTLPQVVTMSTENPAKAIGAEATRSAASRWGGRPTSRSSSCARATGWSRTCWARACACRRRVVPVRDGEAGARVHAGLGPAALGLGAGSRVAGGPIAGGCGC